MPLKLKTTFIGLGALALVSATIHFKRNHTLKTIQDSAEKETSSSATSNTYPPIPRHLREGKPGTNPLSALNRRESKGFGPRAGPPSETPMELSKSSEEMAQAKYFLGKQEYGEMMPPEVNNLLERMTLGEGDEFQRSRAGHLATLAEKGNENPEAVKFLQSLEGVFHSEFVDNLPNANEEVYSIDLNFSHNKLQVAFVLGGRDYYKHVFTDLDNELKTSKSTAVPANLFLELPAKPQDGYSHPMYLEVLIASDYRTLLGVLYNTDQTVLNAANYLHAENLIFKKVE